MERVIEILRQQLELLAEHSQKDSQIAVAATAPMCMLARDIKYLTPSGLNDFPDKV